MFDELQNAKTDRQVFIAIDYLYGFNLITAERAAELAHEYAIDYFGWADE